MKRPWRAAALRVSLAGVLVAAACGRDTRVAFRELHDDDPKVRADAALRLGQAKAVDAVDDLVQALDDPDEAVRIEAIRSLGVIGETRATAALLPLAGDRLETVRLATTQALGALKDPAALPALEKLLADPDPTIRLSAARAVAEIPGGEAVDLLVRSALQDEYERTRRFVLKVVGQRRASEAIPLVERALQTEADGVRATAARVLGEVGDPSSVPVLVRALDDPHFKVRSLSAHALFRLAPSEPEVRGAVAGRLGVEEHGLVRADLAWVLVKMGDRSALGVLRELLLRGSPEDVRAEAAIALGEVGEASDQALLQKATQDKKGLVRSEAYKALQKLGQGPSVAPAIQGSQPQAQPPGQAAAAGPNP